MKTACFVKLDLNSVPINYVPQIKIKIQYRYIIIVCFAWNCSYIYFLLRIVLLLNFQRNKYYALWKDVSECHGAVIMKLSIQKGREREKGRQTDR